MKEEETESENESASHTTTEGGKINSELRTTGKGEAPYTSYKKIKRERPKKKLGCNLDYSNKSNQDDTRLEVLMKSNVRTNRTPEIRSRCQWQGKMNEVLNELVEIE